MVQNSLTHYDYVIMSAMATRITSLTIVYSTVYSVMKENIKTSRHWWPMRNCSHLMTSSCKVLNDDEISPLIDDIKYHNWYAWCCIYIAHKFHGMEPSSFINWAQFVFRSSCCRHYGLFVYFLCWRHVYSAIIDDTWYIVTLAWSLICLTISVSGMSVQLW